MRRLLLFFVANIVFCQCVFAYDFAKIAPSGQTLYYEIISGPGTSGHKVRVASHHPNTLSGDLIIPETVVNNSVTYTVSQIGCYAFKNCIQLTSVVLPNTITEIGDKAFYGCRDLNSVTIPNSVVIIGQQSFYDCTGLTSLTIGYSVETIEASAFGNCYKILSVDIPNSVSTIGGSAFYRVRNVNYHGTSVGGPWGALTLNGYVDGNFTYTDSTKTFLTGYVGSDSSVIIPNCVKRIGNSAFSYSGELKSITIPDSVKWIGAFVFDSCNNLSVVNYNAIDCDSIADNNENRGFFENSSESIKFIIGKKVKEIPPSKGGSGITSVILNADSCIRIGGVYNRYFFRGCTLEALEIGENVKYIPDGAFARCQRINVDTLNIPDSVLTIGAWSIGFGPKAVRIGQSVSKIKEMAFYDCKDTLSTIISKAEVPPQISSDHVFYGLNKILIVPCGTIPSYNQVWGVYITGSTGLIPAFETIREDCGDGGGVDPGSEGITDVNLDTFNVYARDGYIMVENSTHEPVPEVSVFDVMGRRVGTNISASESTSRITVPMTGLYFVKIGDHPTRKVVVIK